MEFNQYSQYVIAQQQAQQAMQDKQKEKEFKDRFLQFQSVESIEAARDLAKKILPTSQPYTRFFVGNIKCTVINKPEVFRISYDSDEEYICYDFC